ncbi:hypothetical protein [uncultured Paraglaciecola sp.]|uniref:helix-turn-helix transcriptional regulator n=1 Tax=uncultured Paraglaciecola sp. TaxID=1765024 RepID=UPI002619B389|nr:hypothetical protein [uncultured Paraglaciecola sp.]
MSDSDDELLTPDEVAEICKVTTGTVANWISGRRPDFPKGFKLGSGPSAPRRWRRGVINQYLRDLEQSAA